MVSCGWCSHKDGDVKAWWSLIRGGNVLLAGVAAWVGLVLALGRWWSFSAWLAILPPLLITAAGNIDNDITDIATDRAIKPERPLITGAIQALPASMMRIVLFLFALVIAWAAGTAPLLIAFFVIIALLVYNRYLSGRPIAGNVLIAALGALPVAYGGLVGRLQDPAAILGGPVVAAVVAFWLHLPREMLKDSLDTEGDRAAGRLTLPMVIGPLKTARWAGIVMFVAACYIGWSAFSGYFGILYTVGILVTVMPAVLLGSAQCGLNPSGHVIARWSFGLKLCMAGGLAWLLLGRITY